MDGSPGRRGEKAPGLIHMESSLERCNQGCYHGR